MSNNLNDPKNYEDLSGPAEDGFAITPSDVTDFTTPCRGIWVGVPGTVAVLTLDGNVLSFVVAVGGTLLPVRARRVNATGTSAGSMVGIF